MQFGVENGDVVAADNPFGIALEGGIIGFLDEVEAAVTVGKTEDGTGVLLVEGLLPVVQPFAFGAAERGGVGEEVGGRVGDELPVGKEAGYLFDIGGGDGAGGSDEGYFVAGL